MAYLADGMGGTVESYPLDPPPDPAEFREVTLIAPPHIMQPHSAPMNADFPELDGDSNYQDDLEIPSFFTSASIHWGQQGKHIPGHNNYQEGKSILTHPDPQFLLDNHSGAGITVRGTPGTAGHKEVIVDFGVEIGITIEEYTGERIPTRSGVIHYSKKGAHIVPVRPQYDD